MNSLQERIAERKVNNGEIAIWWLGGSGFVFKTSCGTICYIDPYLSNSVEAMFNQGRAFAPPILPEEVRADIVVSTHWHEDHLDPGTIPGIVKQNPAVTLIMPPSAMAHAIHWGIPRQNIQALTAGQKITVADVVIEHTPARHDAGVVGWEVPDAMGVFLHAEGRTVYHSGDTEYDIRLRKLKSQRPDVAMVCINGTGGNMNAYEAALLVWQLDAPVVVPMQHLIWAGNPSDDQATLDPQLFADTYQRLGGTGRVVLPVVGGEI